MPTSWESLPVKFEGGWITSMGRLDQGMSAPGSATTLQNFEVSIDGGYSRILGYERYSNTVVPETGNIVGVVVVDNAKCIAYRNSSYFLSSGGAWTNVGTAPTPGSVRMRHDFYKFGASEKIIMVDGLNDPAIFDVASSTLTFDTLAPSDVTGANIVKVFKNHVFFAKGNILTFTAPYTDNDYDTGDGAGSINIGSDITGLIVFREQLIVFSTSKIQRIVGDTIESFQLQPIAMNTGCLCPSTVQEVGGDVMYLGPDGVRYLSATERIGDFALERASSKIQEDITRITNTNCGYTAITIRKKNQYRLFTFIENIGAKFSEGFIGTRFSDQNATDIAWSKTQGIKVYTADSRQFRDAEIVLFSSNTNYIYRMESGNGFDGEGIPYLFETPFMPITDPRMRKTIYKNTTYVNANGNFRITAGLRFDYNQRGVIQPPTFILGNLDDLGSTYGSSTAIYNTSKYAKALDEIYVNNTVGSGFTVAVRYEGEELGPPFTLDYTLLEYVQNERR